MFAVDIDLLAPMSFWCFDITIQNQKHKINLFILNEISENFVLFKPIPLKKFCPKLSFSVSAVFNNQFDEFLNPTFQLKVNVLISVISLFCEFGFIKAHTLSRQGGWVFLFRFLANIVT